MQFDECEKNRVTPAHPCLLQLIDIILEIVLYFLKISVSRRYKYQQIFNCITIYPHFPQGFYVEY